MTNAKRTGISKAEARKASAILSRLYDKQIEMANAHISKKEHGSAKYYLDRCNDLTRVTSLLLDAQIY